MIKPPGGGFGSQTHKGVKKGKQSDLHFFLSINFFYYNGEGRNKELKQLCLYNV